MLKLLPTILIFLLVQLVTHAQDSLALKKMETDLAVSFIDKNDSYEGFGVNGAVPMGGNYKGIVYHNSRLNQVEKIKLSFEGIGEVVYYCRSKSLLKILSGKTEYYYLYNHYYTGDLKEIKDPSIKDQLVSFERVFQGLLALFP